LSGDREESLEERLRSLAERIERLEVRLREESLVLDEVLRELRLLRDVSLIGASIMRAAHRVKDFRYDDISRHIIDALVRVGPMNISQLTKILRDVRGTASRRIISEKVKRLSALGILEETRGKRGEKRYRVKDGLEGHRSST